MKGAVALLFTVVFFVCCSLSAATPILEEHPIKSPSVSDISGPNSVKDVKEVEKVEEVKKPVESGPQWVLPTEYRQWPKFIFRPRPLFVRNVGESGSSMEQLPNVGQKSMHIDMDIADDNVDRALEKASRLLKRMKNTITNNDGFFFKELSDSSENQNGQPHLAKNFLPLLNKMDQTVKKLVGVSVEHKKVQDFVKQPSELKLKHEDERRGIPRLHNRVKALEVTVHFLTWVVLILVFILLFVCITVFLWVSCRLSPNVKRIENGEKGVELPMGVGRGKVPNIWRHHVIPNTFRI